MTMDKQLKRVALVGLALVVILMININYIQGTQAEKLQANRLNTRQYQDALFRDRGEIISADGVKLAFSEKLNKDDAKSKYQRRYVQDGAAFVPVTGFFAGTQQKDGLELAFSSLLDGKDKRQSVNSWLDTLAGKKPEGANLITTVDAKAQRIAFKEIQVTQRRAAAVVMDVKTGAIKVAASFPSFDPNSVADVTKADQAQKKLTELNKNPNAPLVNKAYKEIFPPGSSFKTVVAAAFLQDGHGKDDPVPAPSSVTVPGTSKPITNSHTDNICGAAQAPLIGTFAQSCNTTYALLGDRDDLLGNKKVVDQSRKFGFYEKIKIEDDLSAPASEYPHNTSDHGEILRGSFGQGETKATPLQMAMVAAAIANKGTIMKPYVVQKIQSRDGDNLYEADAEDFAKPISEDSASALEDMMREVVASGTATNLRGRNIAGKTGTTELTETIGGAWFIGFAPADNPKYSFAVFVEGSTKIFGASTAGPIAAAITDSLLKK
ncbi:MAG: penicillin-binding transpeptidase domain-containing protein [Streptosporangiaceae bacterium]